MIHRFEDEYPETKVANMPTTEPSQLELKTMGASLADASVLSASADSNKLSHVPSTEDYLDADEPLSYLNKENTDPHYADKLSRTASNTSLAARAYMTEEEGRVHRMGQGLRREFLKENNSNGTLDQNEAARMRLIRERLERLDGEELKERCLRDGLPKVLEEMGTNARELAVFEREDPDGFAVFRESQEMALVNARLGGGSAVA